MKEEFKKRLFFFLQNEAAQKASDQFERKKNLGSGGRLCAKVEDVCQLLGKGELDDSVASLGAKDVWMSVLLFVFHPSINALPTDVTFGPPLTTLSRRRIRTITNVAVKSGVMKISLDTDSKELLVTVGIAKNEMPKTLSKDQGDKWKPTNGIVDPNPSAPAPSINDIVECAMSRGR
jgi:hypothetical protein